MIGIAGGGLIRTSLIDYERLRNGLDDRHGFRVRYYGVGTLSNWDE